MLTQTPAPTLMARLRSETRDQHVMTEAVPFSTRIVDGSLPLASYTAQLAASLPVHEALERAVAGAGHPALRSVWEPSMRRVDALRADLRALGALGPSPADLPPPTRTAAAAFATWIDDLARRQPVALLGVLYVLEGSTLGGAVLRRHLAAAFQLEDDGLRYYSPYGRHPKPHWVAFSMRMNVAVTGEREIELIIGTARETFDRIREILIAIGAPEGRVDLS
ncbi:MAG: biliverdin-producing heme oxygenase [Candidatus Limnocylindria bacterium]